MKKLTLLVVTACLATTAKTMSAENPGSNFIILAIMGQSNAASYAICPDVVPPTPADIYNFGNDYVMHIAQEPIDDNTNQVDSVSYDSIMRCGSSISIAAELNRITGMPIVIVPCAKGGSGIAAWLPSTSRDTLYGSCLHRIQTVDAGANHKVLIFFFQGEADTQSMEAVNTWNNKFFAIIDRLNSDFNFPPIVFVQVGNTTIPESFPYLFELANKQAEISNNNVLMIKSEDLTLGDHIHLDYPSQQIIGERAAIALYWLMKQK